MNIFFKADKYIVRVESPRINGAKNRKDQVMGYLERYFDMYNHEYLESMCNACRNYLNEIYEDPDENIKTGISTEIQAVTTIIKGLQDFIGQGRHEEMKYMKLLAAKEAFTLYCAMISKSLEYDIIDRKQARRRITTFYKQCGIE